MLIEHLLESGGSGLVSGLPVCRTKGDTNLKMIWFSLSLSLSLFVLWTLNLLIPNPIDIPEVFLFSFGFGPHHISSLVYVIHGGPLLLFFFIIIKQNTPNLASFPFFFLFKQIIKIRRVLFSYTKFASLSQRFALYVMFQTFVALMIAEYLIFMIPIPIPSHPFFSLPLFVYSTLNLCSILYPCFVLFRNSNL